MGRTYGQTRGNSPADAPADLRDCPPGAEARSSCRSTATRPSTPRRRHGTQARARSRAANDVVRKINALVARFRQTATGIQNIVIVGGDELMPMARISDLTTDANESSAVRRPALHDERCSPAATRSSPRSSSATRSPTTPTPSGTTIPWFGGELYLPQIAGRTPRRDARRDHREQLDAFDASNGISARRQTTASSIRPRRSSRATTS